MSDLSGTGTGGSAGKEMHELIKRLFPLCRSLTGSGVRKTLQTIKEYVPITVHEVPSGTKVFDWVVPEEWNIEDAYVKDSSGTRVIDFKKSSLHIVNYSIPFQGTMDLEELKKHLYTLPEQPTLIPYVTSYYEKRWGFCLSDSAYKQLKPGSYEVYIDSTFKSGSMSYADYVLEGQTDEEILISTYFCHPSMANDNLSGPAVVTYLIKNLITSGKTPYYTYRFVYIPETIGSIAYLSFHMEHLREKVRGGYAVTCIGDGGPFSYLQTRRENALVDRVTMHVLKHTGKEYKLYDFLARGSDERQYNAPGVDLGIGSLMRSKYSEYPEYHTSGDDLDLVTAEALAESLEMYERCINVLDNNHKYRVTVLCEPQLGKRGLYPTLSTRTSGLTVRMMMNLLAYCDGERDLVWIAEKINCPVWTLFPILEKLTDQGLLERVA